MTTDGFDIRSYRLDDATYPRERRRALRRSVLRLCLSFLFAAIVLMAVGPNLPGPVVALVTTVLLLVILLLGVRRVLKGLREAWDSYELTMSPNVLRRVVAYLPALEVLRPDVVRIVDAPGKGLTVCTADRHRVLFI